jgi:hypothetical protein
MGRRVAVRILGLASTAKGFAYAVTEGPRRLVLWGMQRGSRVAVPVHLSALLKKSRPLFVSFDKAASDKKRTRGRMFTVHVQRTCESHRVMLLNAQAGRAVTKGRAAITKRSLAKAMVADFRELRFTLPEKRKAWQSEDERMGIFMALAASVAAWKDFQASSPQLS